MRVDWNQSGKNAQVRELLLGRGKVIEVLSRSGVELAEIVVLFLGRKYNNNAGLRKFSKISNQTKIFRTGKCWKNIFFSKIFRDFFIRENKDGE